MRKYVVFMALNERPEVARIALEGVKRLQDSHEVELFAVTHCESDWELAREYGSAVMVTEHPVGRKFNEGLRHLGAAGWEFDYILQLGDDDVMCPSVLDRYAEFEEDVIGGQIMHFYSEGRAWRHHYAPRSQAMMGGGRAISYRALAKCEWELWPDERMNSLDFWSEQRLRSRGAKFKLVNHEGIVDIKYDRNIWGIEHYENRPDVIEVEPEDVRQITGVKLYEQIKELCKTRVTK